MKTEFYNPYDGGHRSVIKFQLILFKYGNNLIAFTSYVCICTFTYTQKGVKLEDNINLGTKCHTKIAIVRSTNIEYKWIIEG